MAARILWVLMGVSVAGTAGTAYVALNQFTSGASPRGVETVQAATTRAAPSPPAPPPVIVAPAAGPTPTVAQAQVQAPVQATPPAAAPKMPTVQKPTEVAPSAAARPSAGQNQAIAERSPDSHFRFDVTINGVRARMMFDTGATVIALRAEDADRLGFSADRLRFTRQVRTANGVTAVAPIMIDTIKIGNITEHDIEGVVHQAGTLNENLLGQTFMARLSSFKVENDRMVLKSR